MKTQEVTASIVKREGTVYAALKHGEAYILLEPTYCVELATELLKVALHAQVLREDSKQDFER